MRQAFSASRSAVARHRLAKPACWRVSLQEGNGRPARLPMRSQEQAAVHGRAFTHGQAARAPLARGEQLFNFLLSAFLLCFRIRPPFVPRFWYSNPAAAPLNCLKFASRNYQVNQI